VNTAIWSAISSPVFQFFGCSILAWSLRQCAPWWQHNAHELSKERHKCLLIRKQLLSLFSHARFGSVYCPCQIWGMGKAAQRPTNANRHLLSRFFPNTVCYVVLSCPRIKFLRGG
jgi:hypothetical protein